MVETVEYNGKIYRRYPDSSNLSDARYFKRSYANKKSPIYLHRQVWKDAYGEIPKGYHIHHVDGDTSNNKISNLVCVKVSFHAKTHYDSDVQRKEKNKIHLDNIRHLTKKWHASEEGKRQHAEAAAQAYKNFVSIEKICEFCKEKFFPKKNGNQDKFCSAKCKSAFRRISGVDDIQKQCPVCKQNFISNKYNKNVCCSRTCAQNNRWRNS